MKQQLPWNLAIDLSQHGLDADLSIRQNGQVVCALGLTATLYIEHGDRPEVREGMVRAYEAARQQMGRDFSWGADPDTSEPQEIATTSVGDVRGWPKTSFQRFDFQMLFTGAKDVDDADAFAFTAVSREREEDQLSYLSVSFPLAWAASHTPDEYLAWMHQLCELVGPSHGYAGLAVVAHPSGLSDDDAQAAYGLGRHFRGLELDFPSHHEPYLSARQLIKGINWLTIVGSSWEQRLGGRQALLQSLAPLVTCYEFQSMSTSASGLLLRAGPAPLLGDLQPRESMPAYAHASRALTPIRSTEPALIWPQGMPGFDFNEAKAWMHRFDTP